MIDPIDIEITVAIPTLVTIIGVADIDAQIELASAVRTNNTTQSGDTPFFREDEFLDEEVVEGINHINTHSHTDHR